MSPKNIATVIVALTVSLGVAECAVRYGYFDARDRELGVVGQFDKYKNTFTDELLSNSEACVFADSFVARSFIGWVFKKNGRCAPDRPINSAGFENAVDFPVRNDPDTFHVLVLGGSVAQLLVPHLSSELKTAFKTHTPLPVEVLNGAIAGSGSPTDLGVTSLYGHFADAIILINGYNEAFLKPPLMPGSPEEMAAFIHVGQGIEKSAKLRELTRRHRRFRSHILMRHSFLGYLIYQELFLKSALAELEALEEVAPPEESIYRYPGKLSTEEMMQLNVEYFERFVRINYQQARVFNAHYAHFLQPIRWIGKELTPREKSYQQSVTPQRYRSYVRAVEAMQGDVPSFSLTEAFQDISTTVYMDHNHPNHEGLTRLAQIIARTTAEQWFNTKTP